MLYIGLLLFCILLPIECSNPLMAEVLFTSFCTVAGAVYPLAVLVILTMKILDRL